MVKIEQFFGTVRAVYTKDGVEQPVFLHQIMSDAEFSTIKAIGNGSILYSIDEAQVGTLEIKSAPKPGSPEGVSSTENTGYVPPKPVPPAAKPASKTVTKPKVGKAA